MSGEQDDLSARYAAFGEPELLALAHDYDSLTEAAQAALRAEFARRNLEPPLLDDEAKLRPESRKLVTLRRYRDLSEAIVARTMIESAGIAVYLRDENLIRLDWQLSNFIGGMRLEVEESDAAAALELLEQPSPETIPFEADSDGSSPEFPQPHCPACGSIDITFEGASRGVAIASLYVLALPLPTGKETWRCDSCGTRWVDSEEVSG